MECSYVKMMTAPSFLCSRVSVDGICAACKEEHPAGVYCYGILMELLPMQHPPTEEPQPKKEDPKKEKPKLSRFQKQRNLRKKNK